MQFIFLNDQECTYRIITAKTVVEALKQHVEYCCAGKEENKVFQILCDSGKMSVSELIVYANYYLLPDYSAIREIYMLGEKVAEVC